VDRRSGVVGVSQLVEPDVARWAELAAADWSVGTEGALYDEGGRPLDVVLNCTASSVGPGAPSRLLSLARTAQNFAAPTSIRPSAPSPDRHTLRRLTTIALDAGTGLRTTISGSISMYSPDVYLPELPLNSE
jgi:hypothetical protein